MHRTLRPLFGPLFLASAAMGLALPFAAQAQDRVVLTVAHSWETATMNRQQQFDRSFMDAHPNIEIRTENSDWGLYDEKYLTRAAAGTLPDVMYISGSWFYHWVPYLADLEPFIATDTAFNRADFLDRHLATWSYRGDLYCVPTDINAIAFFYNRDLFDQAGLTYPNLDWTFAGGFLNAAKKLTVKDAAGRTTQWGFAGVPTSWDTDRNFFGPWGGGVVDDDEAHGTSNTPASVAALKWWAALYTQYGVVGGSWSGGTVGMKFGGVWDFPSSTANGLNYDIANFPSGPAERVTTLSNGSAYCMTKASRHPKEAWTYLSSYLSGAGQSFVYGETGRAVPSRRSAWPSFKTSPGVPPSIGIEFSSMQYGELLHPRGPAERGITEAMGQILPQLWQGQLSPEVAGTQLKGLIDQAIADAGLTLADFK